MTARPRKLLGVDQRHGEISDNNARRECSRRRTREGQAIMPWPPKDATTITVLDTLHKLDTDFGAMAKALENGEFAPRVGSGISRNLFRIAELRCGEG